MCWKLESTSTVYWLVFSFFTSWKPLHAFVHQCIVKVNRIFLKDHGVLVSGTPLGFYILPDMLILKLPISIKPLYQYIVSLLKQADTSALT